MNRLPWLLALLLAACDGWGTRLVPLQFTKPWVAGTADVARRGDHGVPVDVHLRLGDADAFLREHHLDNPIIAFPCHKVRLLYRSSPRETRVLQPRWSHAPELWSDNPEICFQTSADWNWRVLIVPKRGELPLDVDRRLVLVTGEELTDTSEIAVAVLRKPRSEDYNNAPEGDPVLRFVVAQSQWIRLGR